MKRVLLVRHGETAWNAQRRYQGWCDEPLSEAGARQAQRLAARLAVARLSAPVDAVYASDLARAAQTARIIAARHDGLAVTLDPRLREMSFGEWEGLTFDQLQARRPDEVAAWMEDPLHVAPPGGETLAQVAERIQNFYREIVRGEDPGDPLCAAPPVRRPSSVVLVSHGGPLRVLLCLALGLEVQAHWRFRLDVASLSELSVYGRDATLVKLNETASGEREWEN